MNRQAKIKEIKSHPKFTNSRCINTILDAIKAGISLNNEDELFLLVKKAYENGQHKKPSYIKHQFNWTIVFIKQEFERLEE